MHWGVANLRLTQAAKITSHNTVRTIIVQRSDSRGFDTVLFLRYLLKGDRNGKNKNLYYLFDSDKNLHTFVKLKIKWGNRHEFFPFSA